MSDRDHADAIDWARSIEAIPPPLVITISLAGSGKFVAIVGVTQVIDDPWGAASAILSSEASWAPETGQKYSITVGFSEGLKLTKWVTFAVILYPANRARFDLLAAYIETLETSQGS